MISGWGITVNSETPVTEKLGKPIWLPKGFLTGRLGKPTWELRGFVTERLGKLLRIL